MFNPPPAACFFCESLKKEGKEPGVFTIYRTITEKKNCFETVFNFPPILLSDKHLLHNVMQLQCLKPGGSSLLKPPGIIAAPCLFTILPGLHLSFKTQPLILLRGIYSGACVLMNKDVSSDSTVTGNERLTG